MTPCSLVDRCWHFGGKCGSHLQGSVLFRNVCIYVEQILPDWVGYWKRMVASPLLLIHPNHYKCFSPHISKSLAFINQTKTMSTLFLSSLLIYLFVTYLTTIKAVYLLTPCSRVLLDKLTVSQLVKKFPTFYGNRRFITAFTRARQLCVSWARSIQSMLSYRTAWRCMGVAYGLRYQMTGHQ